MNSNSAEFDGHFSLLTEYRPFPWQQALFEEFLHKRFPKTCDIPTGLGKTSIIAIWLLALAHHARSETLTGFPRRLVYVVNRRTVVDQATREAEEIRTALQSVHKLQRLAELADVLSSLGIRRADASLAISTLRGQFADNAEWRNDPSRPAVIVGTVDMIGSRLLFTGYGCGFKSRPLHAGFLGQDALLVHDEAHLEPAFQKLIDAIVSEQHRCNDFAKFRVMALSATSRDDAQEKFALTDADRENEEVQKRIGAKKGIAFFLVVDENKIADEVAEHALRYKDSGQAILIFLRKLKDLDKVADKLRKANLRVQVLTGTLRGLERDALAKEDEVFARFMPKREVVPAAGTVFLVCTSAGEVGVNISADHLVSDLTPFDSMAQRFGRVNRFGDGDARIDIIHHTLRRSIATPSAADSSEMAADPNEAVEAVPERHSNEVAKQQSPFLQACENTLSLLHKLPQRPDRRYNACPSALGELPMADRLASFTPAPLILFASDILFDTWALTSIREKLPGRPPVADWLHGVAEWEPPQTYVAWREEVKLLTGELLEKHQPDDLLEDYPLKPHELLRDRTERIFKHLQMLATTHPDLPVWIIDDAGPLSVTTLKVLAKSNDNSLQNRTVLLPPAAGGLKSGMLDGKAPFGATRDDYDVADKWMDTDDTPRRARVWDSDARPDRMRLVRTIDTRPDADEMDEENEQPMRRYWRWYVRPRSADDDGSRSARFRQELEPHLKTAEGFAQAIVDKLRLVEPEASAVKLAAKWHDLGKHRKIWQRSIGNRDYPAKVLAKSGGQMRPIDLNNFRHEFGSLIDLQHKPEFRALAPGLQDLVLHLIASHHGRARPHFPAGETFDRERTTDEAAAAVAREVPRRFARLQRQYGRWGLAYLESLLRAADALASQANDANGANPADPTLTSEVARKR